MTLSENLMCALSWGTKTDKMWHREKLHAFFAGSNPAVPFGGFGRVAQDVKLII